MFIAFLQIEIHRHFLANNSRIEYKNGTVIATLSIRHFIVHFLVIFIKTFRKIKNI